MKSQLILGLGILCSSSLLTAAEAAKRLITIGGNVSEIVCALGSCEQIIATDSSSLFPSQLTKLPQVGYARGLNAEGLLAQKADLILHTQSSGPEAVMKQLVASGAKLQSIDAGITTEAALGRVKSLGEILGKKAEADSILKEMDRDLKTLAIQRASIKDEIKVLFVYARGNRLLQVSGEHTAAATMLELAGAKNAAKGFTDYKALTPEAAVAAAPDIILMTRDGIASIGGAEGIWKLPGLSMTPAFRNKRIIVMEDLLLLGMGPRIGQAALQLMEEIHPSKPWAATPNISRK